MSIPARQSTALEIAIGPVLDADGVAVTDCVVGDFKLKKTTGNFAALDGSATLVHVSAGMYDLVLTTSDTDTVGSCCVAIDDTVNACAPVRLQVIEEAVYDALYAASAIGYSTLTAAQVNTEADTALSDVGLTTTITGRIDAAVSTRLASSSYTAPLDAAGVRTAVGLASADLDAQLDAIVEDTGTTLPAALSTIAGYIDTEVAAIKAKTDNLPASPAATGDIPSADITAIKAKTDQLTFTVANKVDATATVDENAIATAVVAEIGGTTITVVSPVTSASTIELVQGDDYYHDDSRALTFTLSGTLPAYTDATTTLQLESGRKVVVVSGTVVTATGDTRVVRFEVSKANTKLLPETDVGQFRVVVVLSNGHETTPATGTLAVVRKVT